MGKKRRWEEASVAPGASRLKPSLGASIQIPRVLVEVIALYYNVAKCLEATMSVTTVRLGQDVEETLDALSDKLQRSKSWLINQALKEFIERHELEQIRWKETLDAMESVANGQFISGDAVHTWLRSWGTRNEIVPPRVGQ